jgi:hypothetical protein
MVWDLWDQTACGVEYGLGVTCCVGCNVQDEMSAMGVFR